jgi:DNA-binding transcriptional LysR family regulator
VLLRQLEYLEALARERHFARAAGVCHVSQPALSSAIQRLEADLGVQIVQRGRRFEGFTPEGERVVRWAHRMLADQESLLHDLSSMREGLTGMLRIGAIPTALTAAPLLTAPFCARNPQVRVSLQSLSSREIVHRLAEFDLDVGMTYLDGGPLGAAVRTVPLYRERYLLLTSAGGRFEGRATVSWAELADEPLCLLSPEMQNRRILDRCFAEAGVAVRPSVEADTVSVLYAHVRTRQWSTVIAQAWLKVFGVPAGLQVVPMERPRLSHQVGLVLADRDPEPMLVQALLRVTALVDVAAELDSLVRSNIPA